MLITDSLQNEELIDLIGRGGVGILPTDTLYGIVCRAANEAAVAKLYALKDRSNKPGTLIAASIEQLIDLGIKARYLKAVEYLWPGAISIVIPSHDLAYIHQGMGSVAVRIPSDGPLTYLLKQTGPLLTTSANLPGESPAITITAANKLFGDTLDFYVDGGDLSARVPSTVIRIVDDAIEILRPGAVAIRESGEIIK